MDFNKPATGSSQENLRTEALEKEVQRLKNINQTQSGRLHRLRKLLFFAILFFGVLLVMLYINGLLQWPGHSEHDQALPVVVQTEPVSEPEVPQPREKIVIPANVEDGLIFKIPQDGILYSVQIGAYASIEMSRFELNLLSLQQYTYEGINQYTAGLFNDYEQALEFLRIIQQMGFKDAHIISTRHGKRLSVKDALAVQGRSVSAPDTTSQPAGDFLDHSVVIEEFAGQNP